ncbi:hypothetical protein Tco_0693617 [Tanacetum coccineum]
MEITATIDGKVKVVSEASIRRHLKLEDSDGINTLPNAEIFKQLALMGVHSLGSDEGSLTLNELTVLLKKLEKTVKTGQARRRAKIVVSDNEEDEDDSSKQGRSLIEDMDLDARISLVPPHVADQERIRRGLENVHTFTRRRTVSTSNGLVSTAGMAGVSTTSGLKRLSRLDYEAAVRIQEELDELEKQRMAQVHQAAQGFTDAEWDDILDRVIADEDLVQQLQAGEKYSEEDLLRKLVELVN